MKRLRSIVSYIVWSIVGFYVLLNVLVQVPAVQKWAGSTVASLLANKLGTDVKIGKVNLGFFNRIIIDDVLIRDKADKEMLKAYRLSAKIDLVELATKQKVSVSSAQIFGLNAKLYQKSADTKPNFQFVLDSLASKSKEPSSPLDINIQSLVIRNGAISFDKGDVPVSPGLFNTSHIAIKDLSTHINLVTITDSLIAFNIKKLSLIEHSGLKLNAVSMKFYGNRTEAKITDFIVKMPETDVQFDDISASYKLNGNKLDKNSLHYSAHLSRSQITPSDISCFVPQLKSFKGKLSLAANLRGSASEITLQSLQLNSTNGLIGFKGNGMLSFRNHRPTWRLIVDDMKLSAEGIQFAAKNVSGKHIKLPQELTRLGSIRYSGQTNGQGSDISSKGYLQTTAGNVRYAIAVKGNNIRGEVHTGGIDIGRITANSKFGALVADLTFSATKGKMPTLKLPFSRISAKGKIPRIFYNGYEFKNIAVDGEIDKGALEGALSLDDPNANVKFNGVATLFDKVPSLNAEIKARHLNPQALNLTKAFGNNTFDFDVKANVKGSNLNNLNGNIDLQNLLVKSSASTMQLNNFHVESAHTSQGKVLDVSSDFGTIHILGDINYAALPQSMANIIGGELPTLPGMPRLTNQKANNFTLEANITDAKWIRWLTRLPIELKQPVQLNCALNDFDKRIDLKVELPDASYDDNHLRDSRVSLANEGDSLCLRAYINKVEDDGRHLSLDLNAKADDDKLTTRLIWNTHAKKPLHGVLNVQTEFRENSNRQNEASLSILPSVINYDNSIWQIHPSHITYVKNRLDVKQFTLSNNNQRIVAYGLVTNNPEDSIRVELKDVDVEYIQNMVNFHSVDFAGQASGEASVKNIFHKPEAKANLTVENFKFENGNLGTLHAKADFDADEGQININAIAREGDKGRTFVNGYVSPKKNFIDLSIRTNNTRLDFIESFCGSFMKNVEARGNGSCRIAGDLKAINLTGQLVADGNLDISTLNTTYTLRHDTITMVPNEIMFKADTIYDKHGNHAIVDGAIHHNDLKDMTFDLNFRAHNFLSYDFDSYGENTFFGRVLATGDCYIKGRKGEITFDINATPEKGSFIEYNAASPSGISNREFITWKTPSAPKQTNEANDGKDASEDSEDEQPKITTNLKMNFIVNTTPDFTTRILMDRTSGDYISLHGTGAIRASYFNKGAFEMFGNYLINDGVYKLTIQNVIKKDFVFQPGSMIIFGGDPFNAQLNMKGVYTLNSVSLSDLQVGNSFTSNNVRVDCLMDIGGTPGSPSVTFGLNMPTLNQDAQQMVRSLINSEEDMNQQVLYLLAVGRFMPQGANNSREQSSTLQNQTSLAMQSILSGTISQQINNVLSNVVKSSNWNFGANISTGDEGFNNAEYEGLLSGRLLNNRLLINGQFGYRDNVNTANGSNFIGDFDVSYLLLPNGNIALKVYNQTNDRYFTRNSLYKQGIGVIIKRDFNNIAELFGKKKKKKNKNK